MFRAPVVDIYVTGACNLACQYCFGELDFKAGMERVVFTKALTFAEHAGATAIEFCGGEPLLYKDFRWAVDLVRQRGFDLILRTNGLFLTRHSAFVASHFNSVGISLDGDVRTNDFMRPLKSTVLTAKEKFEIPLREAADLKSLNPAIQIVLASVATRLNIDGLVALARTLVGQRTPIDLWKVYQFLPNNFRARLNESQFSLEDEQFKHLALELEHELGGSFPLLCRSSKEIDGSCLVVNRDGDVLLGANRIGNINEIRPEELCRMLEESGAEESIWSNKKSTYSGIIDDESGGRY